MARSIFCIVSSMLLISSLLIVASAVDYKNIPEPKPEEEDKQLLTHSSYLKPDQSEELQPDDDQLPEEYSEEKEPPSYYDHQPVKPDGEAIPSNNYPDHPNNVINIGTRGFIKCKLPGQEPFPLVGAVARISCLAEDANGYEAAPFYTESHETDETGFFYATFSLLDAIGSNNLKLKECKVFLEHSPMESCDVPTDVNKGVTGAILSSFNFLPESLTRLYTVGPFFYTSKPNSVPANNGSVPGGHY